MTNIEQFINYNKKTCQYQNQNNNSNYPSIDNSDMNIPKRTSKYLLVDNFLSEYNTDIEKELLMQNILLLDKIPTEGSTKLVNSDTVFKVIRENKQITDQLIELINHLQISKTDKTQTNELVELIENKIDRAQVDELLLTKADIEDLHKIATSGSYNDLTNKPTKLSQFTNDTGYITSNHIARYIENYLENYVTDKKLSDIIGTDIRELIDENIETGLLNTIKEKVDKQELSAVAFSGDYIDLNRKPTKLSQFTNDVGYITENSSSAELINLINQKVDSSDLAPVATSGNYNDLQNKPTIQQFIIISESEYEQLTNYVQNAVYLVLEDEEPEIPEHTGWRLGDKLPMILSGDWKLGDGLPIILSGSWKFGDNLPIILN